MFLGVSLPDGNERNERTGSLPLLALPLLGLFVAFGGLFAAGVLSAGDILHLPVPCGANNGCATVAADPSSRFLGVPIAFFGLAAYLAIIWLLTRVKTVSWARRCLPAITGLGALISAGLLVYAQVVIEATCRWCAVSSIAMVILFVLSVLIWRRGEWLTAIPAGTIFWLSAATVFALGGEMWLMQRNASAAPIAATQLASIQTSELLGTPNRRGPASAPVKIIVFSDLWCSVCRALHGPVMAFQAAHPQTVEVIFRHRPLTWVKGHETSETVAALSEIAAERDEFWQFVEKIYRYEQPIDRAEYFRLFQELGLPIVLATKELDEPRPPIGGQLQRDITLADKLGVRWTPTFVLILGQNAPVAVNYRQLAEILNSDTVQAMVSR
jgi:protein-disulfide isomerase/uncharacterized membrane protein